MPPFIRIDISTTIDKVLIESELSNGKEVIVQFVTKSYTSKLLSDLNELCSRNDKNLCIRFYGHYRSHFDCATVLQIPDVKCLHIDCCDNIEHINCLSELLHLEEIGLGIFELQQTEILGYNNFKKLKALEGVMHLTAN